MKFFLKITIIIILFGLFFSLNNILADFDSIDASLWVDSPCGNGICNLGYGETEDTCPIDCGCNDNGVCESARGETNSNCPLDCPVTEEDRGGPRPIFDTTPPLIYNLFIDQITLNSATISWETDEQALCQLFWGRTSEYKEESISENTFYLQHSTKIINLWPKTIYHFKISCRDKNYNESETGDQQFATLIPPDIIPPANVSDFKAVPDDKQITLTWQNPPDLDFKAVRIIRNEKFYPSDPWDGISIYDDKGTSFVDTNLTNGIRYYYTAFAYDKFGNYSSGAIVSEVPRSDIEPPIYPPPPPEEIPPVVPPPSEVEKIKITDFDFIQKEEKISLIDEKAIEAKSENPLTISIDYEKVPEVLKTIMVTLEKGDKFFSFLLRINKEKTAYLATFFVPQEAGIYPITITILDYKNQTLKKIKGILDVKGLPIISPLSKKPWYKEPAVWKWIIYLLFGILFLIIIRYIRKKIENRKNNKTTI